LFPRQTLNRRAQTSEQERGEFHLAFPVYRSTAGIALTDNKTAAAGADFHCFIGQYMVQLI
jgi:hypothetical protein